MTQRSISSSIAHRAAHATWWAALEIAARFGAQFVVMLVLARLLVPADFGLIAMLLVFTSIGALLADAGFATALVQKQHTSDDDETTVFLCSVGIAGAVAVTLWFAAPGIATFYAQPALVPLMRLLLFVLPLGAVAAVPDALLTQKLDFRSRAMAEAIAALCSGVTAIVLALNGFGVWSLAWQAILAIGVRALMLWILTGWRPRGRFSRASFRQLFGFGSYLLIANLINATAVRLESLLVGKLYDSRALGYYTLAQNTQQAPTQLIGGVLNRVGLPVFSAVAGEPAKLVEALRRSLRVGIFVFVPCMVGIAVVAKPLITVVYGPRWVPAAPLLSLLAIAAMFWPLHVLNLAAISARGRSDLVLKLEIVKKTVSIALLVVGSMFSVLAVAWAVLISSLFGVVVNTWYSRSLLGYGMLAQLRDQTATLVLSVVAAAIAWFASRWLSTVPLALAIAVVAAAITYFGGAALFKVSAWRELLGLVRALRAPVEPTTKASGTGT